jgi:hypothetical protein
MATPATRSTWLLVLAAFAACSRPPALTTDPRKQALATALQREVAKSIDAEKSAVLATTDPDSEAFAAESRAAAGEVDRLRTELAQLLALNGRPEERDKLAAFDAAWAKVAAIDARLLPLAVANTNLKAARLSAEDGARAVDRLLGALDAASAGSRDPAVLRAVTTASVAALRIQTLHAPHIAAADEAVMATLEERTQELAGQLTAALATLRAKLPAGAKAPLAEAEAAWGDHQRITAEVFRLSHENTNVLSFRLSTHEKRDASVQAEAALTALVAELQKPPPVPSR